MLLSVSVKSATPCGPATECRPVGESRFPLQIFQTPQKTKTYLVFKCDPLMGPRPSVGQIPISFPAPNFQKSRRLKHNIVVSMRPLKGPATKCRPLLHNENKSVFRSKFSRWHENLNSLTPVFIFHHHCYFLRESYLNFLVCLCSTTRCFYGWMH